MADARLIGRGERAPDFGLPLGPDGTTTRYYSQVGGAPCLVVLTGDHPGGPIGTALGERLQGTAVHTVSIPGPVEHETGFHDPTGQVHGAYGVTGDRLGVVVLDRGLRVVDVIDLPLPDAGAAPDAAALDRVAAVLEALDGDDTPVPAQRQAPVLLIPDTLDVELCQQVIDVYRAADPVSTGVETMADGRHSEALDGLRKQRRDHVVEDPDLLRQLTRHIGRRVMPELRKAFAYSAKRFEGFKIGAYDEADAGFFAAHRDNLSPSTAHRRFALSINLDDGYEGGELRFPEYGPQLFRPAAGEALVFSCAHLHEVLPVTAGRRHVLLSFLFSESRRT